MSRPKLSLNFQGLNAELHATDAAIDPLLVAAKIATIKVDGKEVAASEAPLPEKVKALGGLLATGNQTVDDANLIAANGQLASQVDELNGKLAAATATVAAQKQSLTDTEGKLSVATDSVNTLTAKVTELGTLLEASNGEAKRLNTTVAANKLTITKDCLAMGCVELKDATGKPLAKDASDEAVAVAAKDISFNDLHTAHKAAVTTFFSKNGVDLNRVPANNPGGSNAAPKMKRADFLALAPAAQTEFFKNKGTFIE